MARRINLIILAILAVIQLAMSTTSPSPQTFFKNINGNLTKITWHHAVNSKAALAKAMASDVMMLEADVIVETLPNNTISVVMGHPPNTTSDLSLHEFMDTVVKNNTKGIKLDFKSFDAFNRSLGILENFTINVPFWINADILLGPVNATNEQAVPVDPKQFLTNVTKKHPGSTLSVGWVTKYGEKFNITSGSYTDAQITEMKNILKNNNVVQKVTYPVRAGLAVNSVEGIKSLVKDNPNATLTIWSSEGDHVDGKKLSKLIKDVGIDKVYVDVPEKVWNTLNLQSGASFVTSSMVLTFAALIFATSFFNRML